MATISADASLSPGRVRKRRGIQRRTNGTPLRGLLPLVVVLVAWQLAGQGRNWIFAPVPSMWWQELRGQWEVGTLGPALAASFETFVLALAAATVIGTVLGLLVGRFRFVDRLLGPLLEFCRVMPAAAVVPVAVLFAGYTQSMKVTVVVFTAIWPVLLQVRASARALDPQIFDVARALHLGRIATLRKVVAPSILPGVLLGIRVAAPTVLIIVLLVEIVTGVTGLGAMIEKAQQDYVAARVYGLVALAGVLALIVNAAIGLVESRLLRYRDA